MKFVKLTGVVLKSLYEQGFTVLRSTSPISSENPSWYPDTISVAEHLEWEAEQIRVHGDGFEETHILVIADALEDIREEDLIGEVWL